MILVEVMPCVSEDQIGIEAALHLLEHVLHLGADVREVPVAKPMHDDFRVRCGAHKRLRARSGLALTFAFGAEHDPRDLDLGPGSGQRE